MATEEMEEVQHHMMNSKNHLHHNLSQHHQLPVSAVSSKDVPPACKEDKLGVGNIACCFQAFICCRYIKEYLLLLELMLQVCRSIQDMRKHLGSKLPSPC